MELECHVTGSVPIKVTWSKDHKDIRTGGNYKISCVENTPQLTILKADKADSGRYSCHASNDMGKDSCATEVTVKGIWRLLMHLVFCSSLFLCKFSLFPLIRRACLLLACASQNGPWKTDSANC